MRQELFSSAVAMSIFFFGNCAEPSSDGATSGSSPPNTGFGDKYLQGRARLGGNAQRETGHPEIGELGFSGDGSSCTATVVAPRWVLTAAHCVNFFEGTTFTDGALYQFGIEDHGVLRDGRNPDIGIFPVERILNLGPSLKPAGTSISGAALAAENDYQWMRSHVREALDASGTDDIALVLLSSPVPATVVPASIAANSPATSPPASLNVYGSGCTTSNCGTFPTGTWGTLQVGTVEFGPPSYSSNPPPGGCIDRDGSGAACPSGGIGDPSRDNSPLTINSGDSGGPAMDSSGNVCAVVSSGPATGLSTTFGAVGYLSPAICRKAFEAEPHTWCQSGGPMIVPVYGCADPTLFTEQVVSYVCGEAAAMPGSDLARCCDPSQAGRWDWACVQAGAAWASQQAGIGDVCGRDAWAQGPITAPGPTSPTQRYPRDFSLFVLNDAMAFPDVQGSVAAGGQFSASSFNLAYLAPIGIALVAGGHATVQNGTINGSIYSPNLTSFDFGPQHTLDNSVTVFYGASQFSSPISPVNFGDAFVKLKNMSQALARYPASPSASISLSHGALNITSNERELNIVSLPASQLSGINGVTMTVPTGSTLVVNVTGGTTVTFQSMQVTSNAGSILWNFADTTALLMQGGLLFLGSMLAPDADVRFDGGGMIIGSLVAKSASPLHTDTGSSFEMHIGGAGFFNWPITVSQPSQTIYQIDCGSSSGVSPFGADRYYSGGTARSVTSSVTATGVTNPAPTGVYQSERYGNITYTLPNLLPGAQYTVRLHFAELWWASSGARQFNVTINGTTVLSNFDLYAVAGGSHKAVMREFTANANSSGKIVLGFVSVKDNATIEGIELIR